MFTKTITTIKLVLIFSVLFSFSTMGCAGKKPKEETKLTPDAVTETEDNSLLEETKQAAEAAEWEAHRLREELFRKQNAKKE